MSETFGKYLSEKRKQKQIPRKNFADKVGISVTYLSSIESGARSAPGGELLNRMIKLLYLTEEEERTFYDLAAVSGNKRTAPADIVDYINENQKVRDLIRAARDGRISESDIERFWEKFNY